MKKEKSGLLAAALFICAFVLINPVTTSGQDAALSLFRIGSAPVKDISLQAHETRKKPAHVNESIFMDETVTAGTLVAFPDFEGNLHEYRIIRKHEFISGIVSVSAHSVEDPADVLSFSYQNGAVAGIIKSVTRNTILELNYSNQFEMNMITEVDPALQDILECGLDPDDHLKLHGPGSHSPVSGDASFSNTVSAFGSSPFVPHQIGLADIYDDEVVLDILIVYTPAASLWSLINGGDILLNIANGISLNQIPLDNSNTGILMRVVHTMEVDYDETAEGVTSGITLRRLAARPEGPFPDEVGFFNDVHVKRDQFGADFVAILASVDDTGGLGYLPSSASGRPDLAFQLTRMQQMANTYTFVHELGHNLGNGHSRNQTSQPAGQTGGLFDYSTGWAWQNSVGERNVSVMAYSEGGTRTPYFSSPDLLYDNIPTGSYTGTFSPADNVRSMKEVKYIAGNYRPTLFEPPVAGLPAFSSIEVQSAMGASDLVTLDIANSGASTLFWQLDFSAPEMLMAKGKKELTSTVNDTDLNVTGYETGAGGVGVNFMNADSEGVVYETVFGPEEGYLAGVYNAVNNWKSIFNNSNIRFNITNDNPSVGTQNLRFGFSDEFNPGTGLSVNSPFFGIRPYGRYEVSMDFYIQEDEGNPDYRIIFNDDRTNNNSAEAIFDNRGFVFVRALNETGAPGYIYTGNFDFNTYYNLKVVIDPDTHTLSYYLNEELIYSSGLLAGNIISQFRIYHTNRQTAGGFIDIDNVKVSVPVTGFSWLSSDRYAGNIQPGGNGSINLTFGGPDVEPGTYNGTLIIRTNDEASSELRIPVNYTMDTVVSIDRDTGLPDGFSLAQNYPNPFNPTTEISYTLPAGGPVTLEVFSITGQRIATLVDETRAAGSHSVTFNAGALASGIYVYRLSSGSWIETRKMMLVK